jgi:hypothetical protein
MPPFEPGTMLPLPTDGSYDWAKAGALTVTKAAKATQVINFFTEKFLSR